MEADREGEELGDHWKSPRVVVIQKMECLKYQESEQEVRVKSESENEMKGRILNIDLQLPQLGTQPGDH